MKHPTRSADEPLNRSKLSACCAKWAAGLLAVLLSTVSASAHVCATPVLRARPGDTVTYTILSDRAEEGLSTYSVLGQSDPSVAPLVYYTTFAKYLGVFIFKAQQEGVNNVTLRWDFPPNGAFGFCFPTIIVSTNFLRSAGSYPWSAFYGDPVNMFTGEQVIEEPPDIDLGGPMPLVFVRRYASRLQGDGLGASRLGNNWSHNFDWRLLRQLANEVEIIAPEGLRVRFNQAGTNWVLQSPTDLPFQLVNSASNNLVFGDPRQNRLYTFDTNGLLTAISDGKGNTHTLSYTNDNLLDRVTDGLGRTLTFEYVGPYLMSRVSDGTRSAGFRHVEIGDDLNLTGVTNLLGRVTTHSYDNFNGDGSLVTGTTYPQGNVGYAQTYDSAGRVIQQTRFGTNTTRFSYNTNTFTTTVTNALGQVSVYVHSGDGHLLSLTDEGGQSLTITPNAARQRGRIVDRTGSALGIAYHAPSGKPAAVTNADGTVTSFTYTIWVSSGITFHELASVTLPDGTMEQFTYDAAGNQITHRDRAGFTRRFAFNAFGQETAVTNPAGGVTTFAYNADGTLASRTDAESGTIQFSYDALRRVTNSVAPGGASVGAVWDNGDRIVSLTDERTNTVRYGYDVNNRVTAVTNVAGGVAQFAYDAGNRITRLTDRLGRYTGFAYDSLDRVIAVTNRSGHVTQFTYDSRSRLTRATDPGGGTWGYGYNNEAVAVSATNPVSQVVRQTLDAAGFVRGFTNSAGQATAYGRDALKRVTRITDAVGRLQNFAYDARGLLSNATVSTVGPAGYRHDALGLLTNLTDQAASQWQFTHTPLGRTAQLGDPLNRLTSYAYDSRGRPQRTAFADGTSQTNRYDAAGNLTNIAFSTGLTLGYSFDALNRLTDTSGLGLSYDAENRLTNCASSGVNFAARYDFDGRMTNVTYNNGAVTVTYVYDSRDRLVQVRDSVTSAQINFLYDNAGRLTNVVRANGVNGVYDYDNAGRLTRIREGGVIDLQYGLNAACEVTSLSATAPLTFAFNSGQTNNFTFDAAHQINSPGYAYDARGRLTTAPSHSYAWDAASKLLRADSVTNTYNGAGNLLTRATAADTNRFHYNHAVAGAPIVAEQNAANSQFLRYYIWSPGGTLLYMIDATSGNAVSYFHFDRVGSTLALTSGAGAVTDAYSYSAFGVPVARTGSNPQPFTYVGRYGVRYDADAGLYQMRARYYDPQSARFLSRDPLWPRPADPLSLNPYGYAANNPLKHIDPSGLLDVEPGQVLLEMRLASVSRAATGLFGLSFDWSRGNLADGELETHAIDAPATGISPQYAAIISLALIAPINSPQSLAGRSLYLNLGGGYGYAGRVGLLLQAQALAAAQVVGSLELSFLGLDPRLAEQGIVQTLATMSGGDPFAFNFNLESYGLSLILLNGSQSSTRLQDLKDLAEYGGFAGQLIRADGGFAFINGQLVQPKPGDLMFAAFRRLTFYMAPWLTPKHHSTVAAMAFLQLYGGSGFLFGGLGYSRAE